MWPFQPKWTQSAEGRKDNLGVMALVSSRVIESCSRATITNAPSTLRALHCSCLAFKLSSGPDCVQLNSVHTAAFKRSRSKAYSEARLPSTTARIEHGQRSTSKRSPDSYTLTSHIEQMATEGKLNEAISLVKRSSAMQANSVVWNNLVGAAIKSGRVTLGHQVFLDVRHLRFYHDGHCHAEAALRPR